MADATADTTDTDAKDEKGPILAADGTPLKRSLARALSVAEDCAR